VFYHVWVAAKRAIDGRKCVDNIGLTEAAMERFLVELGNATMDRVTGPHLTFVDPRHHGDSSAMVKNARRLISLFQESGVGRDQIVVSIPATEQGISAAKELESTYGIQTNLVLVSSLIHAAACAEAGATSAAIAVGPLLDWHERRRKTNYRNLRNHPGIETIQSIVAYFKLHKIKTKLIGTNFRGLSEICLLGELDAIALSKEQIEGLRWSQLPLCFELSESSPASLRARQAQYPTALLASKSGFMTAMSAETRSMVAATVYVAIGKMKVEMETLQAVVGREVERQFALQTLDLKTLYRSITLGKKKAKRSAVQDTEDQKSQPRADYFPIHERKEVGESSSADGTEDPSLGSYGSASPGLIDGEEYF